MSDRYAFSLTTFSPSGKLVQIEYALKAVSQGDTSVGIKAQNGIVVATAKKIASTLILQETIEKVSKITPNIGAVYAGLGPDFRVIIDKARKVAHTKYKNHFLEEPPTKILVQDIAQIMQESTQSGGVRPFGISLLAAGWDEHAGYSLYQIDPSGSYFAWKATAIGRNAVSAKTFLEKRYSEETQLDDAIITALLTLKEGFEGEMKPEYVDVGIVSEPGDSGVKGSDEIVGPRFRKLTLQEVQDYFDEM